MTKRAGGGSETIAERIAADVIARIQRGELKPGDPVREQPLATRFQTSRGPVRDALRILDSTFWVTLKPGKGATVATIDTDFQLDSLLIAQVLNGLAARLATTRATAAELDEINRRVRTIVALAPTQVTPEHFSEHTWGLGGFITRLAGSAHLTAQIGTFTKGGLLHMALAGVATAELRMQVARRWSDLAAAMQMRDAGGAETIMRELINASIKAVLKAQLLRADDS